jgi:hypothetical protein
MKTAKTAIEIAKLHLAVGDVLVMRSRELLSREQAIRLRDNAQSLVPEGVKVMVIDRQLELSVLTRAEIEARTT